MDMSLEFNPKGERTTARKTVSPEQPPTPENIFDTKIKKIFSESVETRKNNRIPASSSELEDLDKFLSAAGRFTDKWWENLYTWMDHRDFHREKYLVAETVFDTLDTFPKDAKLPNMFGHWATNALKDPQQKERIVNALDNPEIPSSLKAQIPALLARQPDVWCLEVILKGYKLFGEPVGQEMRKQIVPLFMSGLAVKDVFDDNKDALVQLYTKAVSQKEDKAIGERTAYKRDSIVSRISRYFRKPTDQSVSSSSSVTIPDRNSQQAERRVIAIRNLVQELYPTHEEFYNRWQEFS